jgi:hypothetical protein
MSVSARSYMSASVAMLTAGVIALAPVTLDVATPRSVTADVTLASDDIRVGTGDGLINGILRISSSAAPYAATQAAYL